MRLKKSSSCFVASVSLFLHKFTKTKYKIEQQNKALWEGVSRTGSMLLFHRGSASYRYIFN